MSCNHINVNMGKQDNYIMNSVTFHCYGMFLIRENREQRKCKRSYKEMNTREVEMQQCTCLEKVDVIPYIISSV